MLAVKALRLSRNDLAVQNPFFFPPHFLILSCPLPLEAGSYPPVHWHSAFWIRSDQNVYYLNGCVNHRDAWTADLRGMKYATMS